MPKIKNLVGRTFTRLKVLSCAGQNASGAVLWKVRCSCDGKVLTVVGNNLKSKNTKSCGCLRREIHTTHGEARCGMETREHRAWRAARDRIRYSRYYRGIKMCPRWFDSFDAFLADMGRCSIGMTLERKNNSGDYEPGNCKWATRVEQMNNTHRNRVLEFQGIKQTAKQWSQALGINYRTVIGRLNLGWSISDTLTRTHA